MTDLYGHEPGGLAPPVEAQAGPGEPTAAAGDRGGFLGNALVVAGRM